MLLLLVTWGPGTNVTGYNCYPASSRPLHLQYKRKILSMLQSSNSTFWEREFSQKCYKVPVKSVTSGVYIFNCYMLLSPRG